MGSESKTPIRPFDGHDETKWPEWQLKMIGKAAVDGYLRPFREPRPEPLVPGDGVTGAMINRRNESIKEWDEMNPKAFGNLSIYTS